MRNFLTPEGWKGQLPAKFVLTKGPTAISFGDTEAENIYANLFLTVPRSEHASLATKRDDEMFEEELIIELDEDCELKTAAMIFSDCNNLAANHGCKLKLYTREALVPEEERKIEELMKPNVKKVARLSVSHQSFEEPPDAVYDLVHDILVYGKQRQSFLEVQWRVTTVINKPTEYELAVNFHNPIDAWATAVGMEVFEKMVSLSNRYNWNLMMAFEEVEHE